MGPAMSQQIVWEVFNNTLEAADVLGIDDELVAKAREARTGPRASEHRHWLYVKI